MSIITDDLLRRIKQNYTLDWYGTHGVYHWFRVWQNGIRLSRQAGVNQPVVELFSIFHDSQRLTEDTDHGHGSRGADLALQFRKYIDLSDDGFELLLEACRLHTTAKSHHTITVQVCFDSDRLDIGRAGIKPVPELLCSPLPKNRNIIEWAYTKSLADPLLSKPFLV